MKQQQCSICSSEREEVKVLLAYLRRKIIKQSQEYVPDYKEEEPDRDSSDSFSRLLMLIFGRTATSHATFLTCPHLKFSRYFRRKLKCDNSTFNSLCSQIADKLAERNYQLETLHLQLGSIARTAVQQQNNPLSQHVAAKVESERRERQKKSSEGVITEVASRQRVQQEGIQYEGMNYWVHQPPIIQFPWLYQRHHN